MKSRITNLLLILSCLIVPIFVANAQERADSEKRPTKNEALEPRA